MTFGDGSLLQSLITGIHLRSNFGPNVDILNPFAPNPEPSAAMEALQPSVTIDISGSDPLVLAPYGQPVPSAWAGILALGGVTSLAVLALAAYGAYRLLDEG